MPQFLAGVAEMDITPSLGSALAGFFRSREVKDIDDPLRAKALVLDDGTTRLAVLVLDLLGLHGRDVATVRRRVAELTQIPEGNVMVSCTHTHTGPSIRLKGDSRVRDEEYMQWMTRRAADTIRLAELRLQPARVASGSGELHGVCFCRRWRMRDGTVVMNPEPGDPNIVEPVSPVDPTVGVLYVEDAHGRPLSVLAQYGLHYVGTDKSGHISADYFGHYAAALRRILGPDCQPMLMNGTSGQVNNLNPLELNRPRGHKQARRVAAALAAEVARVIATMPPAQEVTLGVASETVNLPRKKVTLADVEEAERILSRGDAPPMEGRFSFAVGQPIPPELCDVYARDCRVMYEAQGQEIPGEVQAFRIGDSAWIGLPGEVFVEIGLGIKQRSPLPRTFVVGIVNDYLGYISTDHAQLHEGGYETWARPGSSIGVGAQDVLQATALRVLERATAHAAATPGSASAGNTVASDVSPATAGATA